MKQPSLAHVLQPKWRTALQRLREERANGGSGKLVILALVGGAFWVGVFGVLYRILKALRAVEELGPLIPGKILGLILLSFISILVLSNVITALSSFFLAKDLDLLVSAPVDWLRLYLAKLGETLLHSSWMVALMAVPILTAYGVVFKGGVLFAPYAVLAIVPMLILPAVLGSAVTLTISAVMIGPVSRIRDMTMTAGSIDLAPKRIRLSRVSSDSTTPIADPARATRKKDFDPTSSICRMSSRTSYGGVSATRTSRAAWPRGLRVIPVSSPGNIPICLPTPCSSPKPNENS